MLCFVGASFDMIWYVGDSFWCVYSSLFHSLYIHYRTSLIPFLHKILNHCFCQNIETWIFASYFSQTNIKEYAQTCSFTINLLFTWIWHDSDASRLTLKWTEKVHWIHVCVCPAQNYRIWNRTWKLDRQLGPALCALPCTAPIILLLFLQF